VKGRVQEMENRKKLGAINWVEKPAQIGGTVQAGGEHRVGRGGEIQLLFEKEGKQENNSEPDTRDTK